MSEKYSIVLRSVLLIYRRLLGKKLPLPSPTPSQETDTGPELMQQSDIHHQPQERSKNSCLYGVGIEQAAKCYMSEEKGLMTSSIGLALDVKIYAFSIVTST